MKKKIFLIIISLVVTFLALTIIILGIAFLIYRESRFPSVFNNEYYIVDFENSSKTLSNEKEENIRSFLELYNYNVKDVDNIKITKLAYQTPFRHEGNCYIFFKTNLDERLPFALVNITDNYKEYMVQHICGETYLCEEFIAVQQTVKKYYNIWENNEKYINDTIIEEPPQTEEKDKEYENKYDIIDGKKLFGKIIDITDKYLQIQEYNGSIKLVAIKWHRDNFIDYRTKNSLTIYRLKEGYYFYNRQIIPNITEQEISNIIAQIQKNQEIKTTIEEIAQSQLVDITDELIEGQNNCSYSGNILEVMDNTIVFRSMNKIYKVNYNEKIELLDARTEETIKFQTIKENDYISCSVLSSEREIFIASKKTGEDLKIDLLKNMSIPDKDLKSRIVNTPYIKNINIINSEKAIMTIEFGDLYNLSDEIFELNIILNSNTEITSKGRNTYNIETLNNSAHDIVTIVLDKNTIYDDMPICIQFCSSDS